ncbi:energy transducer TonB [Sphaerospermopsis sp. LEGE 08334]|jgi:TonB family protein|uniref:energy transducer TonB n=1 Tax=Sphaerospermopsis sp. LEGE 08334 TaxID=1828651 RepID=UPI00187F5A97|nr:energy transducer TonB [Sphaerospermopsis sp. LEGE 08334]MBE9056859.1 energy transducer TonB [Sphaerospermopsis sp. LEGE 08334]
MSFSSTALEQREKELKTLKTFLTYSLIGSLAIHIGLLASGIGSLLTKAAIEETEEPLEITFVETPPEEKKPIEEPQEEIKPQVVENSRVFTSTNNSSDTSATVFVPQPVVVQKQTVQSPVIKLPIVPAPKIEPLKPLPSVTQATVSPQKVYTPQPVVSQLTAKASPKTADTQPQSISETKNTPVQPSSTETTAVKPSSTSSTDLSKLLAGIRDSRANQEVSELSQANADNGGNTVGRSTGLRVRRDLGNVPSVNNEPSNTATVATAPTQPKINTNTNTKTGSGNGRAACRECNTSYPDWAKRRGVEGRVEVAVDTDNKGNVTNVRLLRSSGNDKLDAEHLERAQKWKLKPSSEGRQGVTIGTEYAIAGSQRHRQLQERKKKRETEKINTASTNNASNSTTETPRRRRRVVTSVSNDTPQESTTTTRTIRSQRSAATSSTSTSTSTTKSQRLGEALRSRRKRATNNSSSSGETRKRRRREIKPASSVTTKSESSSQPTRRRRRLEQPASSEQNQQPSPSGDAN